MQVVCVGEVCLGQRSHETLHLASNVGAVESPDEEAHSVADKLPESGTVEGAHQTANTGAVNSPDKEAYSVADKLPESGTNKGANHEKPDAAAVRGSHRGAKLCAQPPAQP